MLGLSINITSVIGVIGMIVVVYVMMRMLNRKRKGVVEGFESEPINKEELQKSIDSLRNSTEHMLDSLYVKKNRQQYEIYLIELYNHIQTRALKKALTPNISAEEKMKLLEEIDIHYKPVKDMLNDSIKYLNEIEK